MHWIILFPVILILVAWLLGKLHMWRVSQTEYLAHSPVETLCSVRSQNGQGGHMRLLA